ncbi:MAG: type II secretion system minor pseudopilin GspJ [Pseudomonadota bacterium]
MIKRRQKGFTLVEMLVSVFVFAILSAISYATLNETADRVRQVNTQMSRLQSIQRTLQLMQMDFSQISPRPVRQELADEPSPALLADSRNEYLVELTRGGWTNPLNLQRPGLQRVAYYLDEDKLIRRQWQVLDRTLGLEPPEQVLLEDVEELTILYLPGNGEWTEAWPTRGNGPRSRPRAVDLTFTLKDYGEIRRVIEVTG